MEGMDEETSWREIASSATDQVIAIVPVLLTDAIVITQDCDAQRARDITLCQVRDIGDVTGYQSLPSTPKKWINFLRQRSQENLKWFYLPSDAAIDFLKKKAVDFQVTLSVPRADLEAFRTLRRGRLNDEAYQHFRERLAEYFRRYPVDEWYPYDPVEFAEYRKDYTDASPRPYQVPTASPPVEE